MWWFYSVVDKAKWFSMACIGCLLPGQSASMHTHSPEMEGPYECWYVVLEGKGELRTEFADYPLERFDAAFMPPGAAHQMRNAGTEPMYWLTLSSRGGAPLKVDVYAHQPAERPGYRDEYKRIMKSRKERGLRVP
jgi:oxalate decarboxylase/phosphoglucose isomerase-like protein (cupin superfamily)